MYNFEVYKGKFLPQEGFPDIGASGNIVLRMASIVPRVLNYILYFDNWFCGVYLQVVLKKVGISSVETVHEARLKGCKLPSDKDLKKKGRGSYVEMATTFEGVSLRAVEWFDNHPVTLLSTFASALPEPSVKLSTRRPERLEAGNTYHHCQYHQRGVRDFIKDSPPPQRSETLRDLPTTSLQSSELPEDLTFAIS
ncbi:hypothetical protein HPB51_005829 [Rhipicephalus microplus]|uniref:PiggyBac transposable element-derived protein domain-containing protein n=1 Tax=Rhipicephalus microplus TaxID=6941 RepID=A0A9J6EMY4_RHIMP|nr:hypothetical protein HPB51_005829 [Rhipicephalus microplus]